MDKINFFVINVNQNKMQIKGILITKYRILLKTLPKVMVIHLKRFKYDERCG